MKRQAERASRAHVDLHVKRQKALGERMIGDKDRPGRWDLIVTMAAIGLIIFGSMRGWW